MEIVTEVRSHGGRQLVVQACVERDRDRHDLLDLPAAAGGAGRKLPVVWYLSGLTCTHANVTEKGEYRAACAELGLIFVAPDTSPRGEGVPDAEGYDFGQGAGFYVDATQEPWARHFRMWSYVTEELPELVAARIPGRHGAPGDHRPLDGRPRRADHRACAIRSGSAASPPSRRSSRRAQVPWGEKALGGYLGEDRSAWRKHDAVALIEDGARLPELLVDIGTADPFLEQEFRPELLEQACADAGIALTLNRREGYDHSYYFISTFMADHLRWHAERLR